MITKHNAWITGKKFLLVPCHMIGAHDMESGILGGYVDFMRRTHPDAPIPGVYLAEGLFRDAQALRARLGDDAFFNALSEGTSSSDWGELAAGWDGERFEKAIIAPPGAEERSQLISALIGQFVGSYDTQSGAQGKPALREKNDAVLADEVRKAISSPQRRIVGVVDNAIDDHLLKGLSPRDGCSHRCTLCIELVSRRLDRSSR